ncbi:hypothetical protein F4778DRAFT_782636 [Xylariomycetidae sp. FL2044]|nr:hypothetical protein F4778DRAFT_782636 [Xylariomycetidae sp. FL2044]
MADTQTATATTTTTSTTTSPPTPTPTTPHSRTATVHRLIEGFSSLSVPQILQPLASDFEYQVLPASLGLGPKDREAFARQAAGIFSIFDHFKLSPISITDGGGPDGWVFVHANMSGTLKTGHLPWQHECVMMVQLSDDGQDVVKLREFVDTAKARELGQNHEIPGMNL